MLNVLGEAQDGAYGTRGAYVDAGRASRGTGRFLKYGCLIEHGPP